MIYFYRLATYHSPLFCALMVHLGHGHLGGIL